MTASPPATTRREADQAQGQRPDQGRGAEHELKDLHRQIDAGISGPAPSNYTLRRAAEDWQAAA